MKSNPITRMTLGGALLAAFVSGLVFASGLDLTRFGYAQSSTRPAASVAPVVPPAAVSDLNVAFSSIAERVTPAVVSIHSERTQRREAQSQPRQRRPGTLEDFFGQFDREPPVPQEASGSGFIVSQDGYILTNNHVIQGFDRVEVTLTDRRTFPARVIGRDETTDVAVLKIDERGLPHASLGDDNGTKIGEWVVAIGNPLGLDFTVTAGIVSAKGRGQRDVRLNNRNSWSITDFIQTDAAINPGNSGGPLVNVRGEVIGINTAIASQTGYYSGYGFAIPITLAKEVLDDFIEHGRVRRAVLGVSIVDAEADDAAVAGLKTVTGVLVQPYTDENPNSPARRAGIEPNDVIVKADGKLADRVSTLQRIIRSHEPGDVVEIEAWRYGTKKTFSVRLGEASDSTTRVASNTRQRNDAEPSRSTSTEKLGITVEPISDVQARENQITDDHRGLRIVDVDPNGMARQRLFPNDILVAVVNPQPRRTLRSAQDLQQVLASAKDGSYLSFMVYNIDGNNTRIVNLRVGK
jgi:serine protease Do